MLAYLLPFFPHPLHQLPHFFLLFFLPTVFYPQPYPPIATIAHLVGPLHGHCHLLPAQILVFNQSTELLIFFFSPCNFLLGLWDTLQLFFSQENFSFRYSDVFWRVLLDLALGRVLFLLKVVLGSLIGFGKVGWEHKWFLRLRIGGI